MARRFKCYSDCRRYLSSLINRVEAGELPAEKATKLAYIANYLIKCLEIRDLERLKADMQELQDREGGENG